MRCRSCNGSNLQLFADLGHTPPSNAYLSLQQLSEPEVTYPLRVKICVDCWLAQVDDDRKPEELFTEEYAYLSCASDSWVEHARQYCADITRKLSLGSGSFVVELASNDGYLLQNFVGTEVAILGIEPTLAAAEIAEKKGIPVLKEFFGVDLARRVRKTHGRASLIIGNNVLAHVPDINDFVGGCAELLREEGLVTFEFPHLLELLKNNQFDTIYHEHYSYLSLHAVQTLLDRHGLAVVDVEKLSTHGGSLRVYGKAAAAGTTRSDAVEEMLEREVAGGLTSAKTYENFQIRVDSIRDSLLQFLLDARNQEKTVFGYGAAAKGNTLLNYCGVRAGVIRGVFDRSHLKVGRFLPGSHIPVLPVEEERIREADFILILPWNLAAEVTQQLRDTVRPGCRFVTALPQLRILNV